MPLFPATEAARATIAPACACSWPCTAPAAPELLGRAPTSVTLLSTLGHVTQVVLFSVTSFSNCVSNALTVQFQRAVYRAQNKLERMCSLTRWPCLPSTVGGTGLSCQELQIGQPVFLQTNKQAVFPGPVPLPSETTPTPYRRLRGSALTGSPEPQRRTRQLRTSRCPELSEAASHAPASLAWVLSISRASNKLK